MVRTKSGQGRLNRDLGTGEELAGGSELATSPDRGGGGLSYAARDYSLVRPNSFRTRTILPAAALPACRILADQSDARLADRQLEADAKVELKQAFAAAGNRLHSASTDQA